MVARSYPDIPLGYDAYPDDLEIGTKILLAHAYDVPTSNNQWHYERPVTDDYEIGRVYEISEVYHDNWAGKQVSIKGVEVYRTIEVVADGHGGGVFLLYDMLTDREKFVLNMTGDIDKVFHKDYDE